MFPNENFPKFKAHLKEKDHPELDNTELCNEEQIPKYIYMIGQLQWSVTLGRCDILAHVMSMSRFSTQNWTFGDVGKVIGVSFKNQTLCY